LTDINRLGAVHSAETTLGRFLQGAVFEIVFKSGVFSCSFPLAESVEF